MPTYKLNNLLIKIPFTPYASQLQVITKITDTIIKNKTCLIESPTGTGKSMSIIASIMPFLDDEEKKIYLCTRTHKQIQQMVLQIKQFVNFCGSKHSDSEKIINLHEEDKNLTNTEQNQNKVNYPIRMSILGSRNVLCINEKINTQPDINTACGDLVKHNKCKYFANHAKLAKNFQSKLFDLEELIKYAKRNMACPYYATKVLSEKASLILSPYNYLIDPFIRKRLSISKAHIIIDEAHNIEDNIREAGSLIISMKEIIHFINQIYSIKDQELIKLVELFNKLKQMYFNITKAEDDNSKRMMLEESSALIENKYSYNSQSTSLSDSSTNILFRFKELINLIKENFSLVEINNYKNIIYSIDEEIELDCLRKTEVLLYVLSNIVTNNKYALNVERGGSMNFILLEVSDLFNDLLRENLSLTLLSGTIGDIKVYESDLKHSFSNKVINDHVIGKENLFIRKVLSYKKMNLIGTQTSMNEAYFKSVAIMVQELYKNSKGGVLVFLQSYSLLQKIKSYFTVKLFIEPNTSSELESVIIKFKNEALNDKALLIGVYRGKLSEGIDFKDRYCRLVIAVSIPYPNIGDIVVKIKKENKYWYENQALKAVNQAVGRVIRHKDDYGGIILLDNRYKYKKMSNWIERSSKECTYEECIKEYKEFVNRTK